MNEPVVVTYQLKGVTVSSTTSDVWTYRRGIDAAVSGRDLVGYGVEALDGSIGKVDGATYD